MKLPEYLLSTPRLVLIILTLCACVFTYMRILTGEQFMSIVTLVLWYFFGSRGKEESTQSEKVVTN